MLSCFSFHCFPAHSLFPSPCTLPVLNTLLFSGIYPWPPLTVHTLSGPSFPRPFDHRLYFDPDHPFELQTCTFRCLQNISTWMSHRHLKSNLSKTKLMIIPNPSLMTLSSTQLLKPEICSFLFLSWYINQPGTK